MKLMSRNQFSRNRALQTVDYRDRERSTLRRWPIVVAAAGAVAAAAFVVGLKVAERPPLLTGMARTPLAAEAPPVEPPVAIAASESAKHEAAEAEHAFAAEVDRWVASHAVALKPCYDAYLAEEPAVTEGRVTMNWQIDPDGFVVHPEVVATDLDGLALADCLVAKLSAFVFPPPPDHKKNLAVHNFDFRKG